MTADPHVPRSSNGCPDEASLYGLVEGALPSKEAESCEAHLALCQRCGELVEAARVLQGLANELHTARPTRREAERLKSWTEETLKKLKAIPGSGADTPQS